MANRSICAFARGTLLVAYAFCLQRFGREIGAVAPNAET